MSDSGTCRRQGAAIRFCSATSSRGTRSSRGSCSSRTCAGPRSHASSGRDACAHALPAGRDSGARGVLRSRFPDTADPLDGWTVHGTDHDSAGGLGRCRHAGGSGVGRTRNEHAAVARVSCRAQFTDDHGRSHSTGTAGGATGRDGCGRTSPCGCSTVVAPCCIGAALEPDRTVPGRRFCDVG